MQLNPFLLLGAMLSGVAAALHVGIVIKGTSWYRFFGAGESFAVAAERGRQWPRVVTLGIASVLLVWSAYALSGAGLVQPLPQLQFALAAITAVYLLRGAAVIPLLLFARSKASPFIVWSSAICLVCGFVHAVGLAQVWPRL